jgi:NADPH2 dehydrogenase
MTHEYRRIARLRKPADFQAYLDKLGIELPFDEHLMKANSPLGEPLSLPDGRKIGNRFCVLPMEGWDGTPDGRPTELTARRWRNFGRSGAKLIWGCEAVAVRHDGRANPNQLVLSAANMQALEKLRTDLVSVHSDIHGPSNDLLVGLQLTHSGRYCRPNDKKKLEPKILYHHPILDGMAGIDAGDPVLSDEEIRDIVEDFIIAAKHAQEIGFDFVDVKHCHGYLGHEFLTARTREGEYGGSFENRTRFLREIVGGIRRECPGLLIGVRLSAFDLPPFRLDQESKETKPIIYLDENGEYPYGFGVDPKDPCQLNLEEPIRFLEQLKDLDICLVCITAGSPYYNPHIQRPAYFPPQDGYPLYEDPLAGVARQINVTAQLKAEFPEIIIVGSAYTYLQDWLPFVAQRVVREGMVDSVGLGRMMLSYPELPSDVLAGKDLDRKRICRTFSDCTTAPRAGLVSGCYPLDDFYSEHPDAVILKRAKSE